MQAFSPYGVLRLKPGCKEEELKAAYKKRILETHPDKGGTVEEFRAVQTAYEALQKSLPVPETPSSSSSRVPRPDSFTPFNVPHFPPAFRPPPKRRKTLEETIEAAFAGIPRAPKAPSVRPPAKPLRPPKRVQPKPKASPTMGPSGPSGPSSPGPSKDDWATKLWAELVQLSADKRAAAITALPAIAKARLKAHLQAQKEARAAEAASSSSSSSSETSDEAEVSQARSRQPVNTNRHQW